MIADVMICTNFSVFLGVTSDFWLCIIWKWYSTKEWLLFCSWCHARRRPWQKLMYLYCWITGWQTLTIQYSAHNMIVTTVQNPYQKALRIRADHLVSTMQKSSGLVYQSPLVKTIKEIGFGSVAKIKIQFAESFWDLKNSRFMILLQDKPLTITRDIGTRCCTLP